MRAKADRDHEVCHGAGISRPGISVQERVWSVGLRSDRRGEGADPHPSPGTRDRAPRPRRRDPPAFRRPGAGAAAAAPPQEAQARPEGPDPEAARAADSRHHRLIALIQRVAEAKVAIGGENVGSIGAGILALIGIEKTDGGSEAQRLAERVLGYRIFPDAAGKMNLSLKDVNGGLLVVPQFTLVADTNSGTRPSFSSGASPEVGKAL